MNGGNTSFKGFVDKFEAEVKNMKALPEGLRKDLRVIQNSNQSVWRGIETLLGCKNIMKTITVTKEDFEEFGPSIV